MGNDPSIWKEQFVESKSGEELHPCVKCGACCASFRVAFYWREAESKDHKSAVPEGYWHELSPLQRGMNGTDNKHHPKCCALKGRIGEKAYCTIYNNRPTPCRTFEASYENGVANERCDLARQKHGLKPLCKMDWVKFKTR
jgi:uncharacterized protein